MLLCRLPDQHHLAGKSAGKCGVESKEKQTHLLATRSVMTL